MLCGIDNLPHIAWSHEAWYVCVESVIVWMECTRPSARIRPRLWFSCPRLLSVISQIIFVTVMSFLCCVFRVDPVIHELKVHAYYTGI